MLWICKGCTAAYSVGAPACPQCGADDHFDEGAAVIAPEPEPELVPDDSAGDED